MEIDRALNAETELTRCLLFSRLDKRKYYEKFYLKELESLRAGMKGKPG